MTPTAEAVGFRSSRVEKHWSDVGSGGRLSRAGTRLDGKPTSSGSGLKSGFRDWESPSSAESTTGSEAPLRITCDITLMSSSDEFRVGAHVSIAGGIDNAVDNQVAVGGNCGQIFTHSPQVWQDPDIDDEEADRFRAGTSERLTGPWVIHSSYLVNLCTPKEDLREKSIQSMQAELDAAAKLDIDYVNVHLGAHTGAGVDRGLSNAASAIEELDIPEGVKILIESDAGGGTKLGDEFEHLAEVLAMTDRELDVCLDTAHMFAAGYDLSTSQAVDETIEEFDETVGLDRLACLHLNDSKHDCGTNKDEHAHIGEGRIGKEGMRALINHPKLRDVPFVLETPNEAEKGFEWDIDRARQLRR